MPRFRCTKFPLPVVGFIWVFSFFLSSSLVAAVSSQVPFEAEYSITVNGMKVGRSIWSMTHLSADLRQSRTLLETIGFAAMLKKYQLKTLDQWQIEASQVRMLDSQFTVVLDDQTDQGDIKFNWSSDQAQVTDSENSHQLPIPTGTISRSILPFVMAKDLASGKTTMRYSFVDSHKGTRVRFMSFSLVSDQALKTKLGQLHTKVLKQDNEESASYYWFAPELNYLMVKMQHPDEVFDSNVITKIEAYRNLASDVGSNPKP